MDGLKMEEHETRWTVFNVSFNFPRLFGSKVEEYNHIHYNIHHLTKYPVNQIIFYEACL